LLVTVDTIEKHYAPFVKELRERVRRLMQNGQGIEQPIAQILHSSPRRKEGFNENT